MVWFESLARKVNLAAEQSFSKCLSVLPGKKVLYVDPVFFDKRLGFVRTLDLFLTDAVVSRNKIVGLSVLDGASGEDASSWLQDTGDVRNFIFFTRSSRSDSSRCVAKVVKSIVPKAPEACFLVICVPFASHFIEEALEDAGVHGDVLLRDLGLGFLGLEDDLLTLDWTGAVRELWNECDASCVKSCASALIELEKLTKTNFTVLRSAGEYSHAVIEHFLAGKSSTKRTSVRPKSDLISSPDDVKFSSFSRPSGPTMNEQDELDEQETSILIVIDRSADLVTPLLTQWTYEGMLDEVFGMTNSVVEFSQNLVSKDLSYLCDTTLLGGVDVRNEGLLRKEMSNDDTVFRELRDDNFAVGIRRLGNVATGLRSFYAARPRDNNSDLEEVKDFVKDLGGKKEEHDLVSFHTALAEELSARTFENENFRRRFELERRMLDGAVDIQRWRDFVKQCAAMQETVTSMLRLVALFSQTQGPISRPILHEISTEIEDAYGIEWLALLQFAEKARLIIPNTKNDRRTWLHPQNGTGRYEKADYSWMIAKNHFRLVHEYEPEDEQQMEDAAYSGFVPVTTRLVEAGLSRNEWLSSVNQRIAKKTLLPTGERASEILLEASAPWPKRAFVVVLGGATRAELSSMRQAIKLRHRGTRVVFGPTSLLSGDSILAELLPPSGLD